MSGGFKMKIALIDSLALTYSARYAIPALYNNDEETGIVYGFFRYILALQKQFNFDQLIFCFDSRRSKRKELYSGYKGNRHLLDDTQKLVYSQVDVIKELLPWVGFNNLFETEGLEADDVIGSLCQTKKSEDEYIIISRDGDLYQLLDKNISQYDYVSKKLITERSFIDKYDVTPDRWGLVKAIGGCKSDQVPGIRGVGVKTIAKYLNGNLKESSKAFGKIESDEGQNIIERNGLLVILPFDNTPEYEIIEDELKFESLLNMFMRFNFQSMLRNESLKVWRESFNWIDIKRSKTTLDDFC